MLFLLLACTRPAAESDLGETDAEERVLTDQIGICDLWQADALRTTADLDADAWAVDEAVDLGIGIGRPHRTRGHAFSWNIVRATPESAFDWTLPDHVVAESQARGVDLFVTIYPFADQVPLSEAPAGLVPLMMTGDEVGWRAFVRAMAERYDGDGTDDMPGLLQPVRYWEIGNEAACAEGDLECYGWMLDLTRTAYEEIHAADGAAVVLPAGAAPGIAADGTALPESGALYTWFVDQGGLAYADAFSFHMATGEAEPPVADHVAFWRGIVGDEVPLWLGEVASRSLYDARIIERDDPQAEADWLVGRFTSAFDLGVEKAFWCRTGGPLDRAPVAYGAMQDYVAGLE